MRTYSVQNINSYLRQRLTANSLLATTDCISARVVGTLELPLQFACSVTEATLYS